MPSLIMRNTSRLLVVSMLYFALPLQPAQAGLIATEKVGTTAQTAGDRERIRTFLEREDVRMALQQEGIDAGTARARVDALTDEEVKRVAGRLDQAPAGGDIIGVLFTIFVVLLVTDILGFTKVFSFTRPIR